MKEFISKRLEDLMRREYNLATRLARLQRLIDEEETKIARKAKRQKS